MELNTLAHRGLWHDKSEQNTLLAIEASWESGFGIETDIRDQLGKVVISHDPPGSSVLEASALAKCTLKKTIGYCHRVTRRLFFIWL
jgi:glycerophosphoryl diester phosphodiesterase